MTLMPRKLIAEQSSNAKIPAEDLRLALTGLLAPNPGTANAARTGLLRGSGASGYTACQVIAASASTFTIKQGSFVVQQATTNGGAYIGVIDSDQTLSISASLPSSGNFKAGYVIAHCYDSAYGDSQDGFAIEAVLGAAASSVGGAAYPTVPTNAVVLSGFTVTSAGTITLTTAPAYTNTHGAILPVLAGDTTVGAYDGEWRDEPVKGFQRWYAGASPYGSAVWARPHQVYLGSGTAWPTSGVQVGDTFTRADAGNSLWAFTGTGTGAAGWTLLQGGALEVADSSHRDALVTAGLVYPGLIVRLGSDGSRWVYSGGSYSGAQTWEMVLAEGWTLNLNNNTYNYGVGAAWADLPGAPFTRFVPLGRTLDCEFTAPYMLVSTSGQIDVKFTFNGNGSKVQQFIAGPYGSLVVPCHFTDSWMGQGANVTVSVQARGVGAGGFIQAGDAGGAVVLRSRVI